MLRDIPDEGTARLVHEAQTAEANTFWRSLDADQARYVAMLMRNIVEDEEPSRRAGIYFGHAEFALQMFHSGCMCGDSHRDPDDLLKELTDRGAQFEIETEQCSLYKLRRIATHDPGGGMMRLFVCIDCGHAYESIEQRRKAGDPGKCPGCMNSE